MTTTLMLDTHVLLWMLTDPARLSARVTSLVTDRRVQLRISAGSAWEIATKHRIGKLPGAEFLVHSFHDHLRRIDVVCEPITADHALLAGTMLWAHRDPFDRMIAAQCLAGSTSLVTSDAAFHTLNGLAVVW